MRARHHSFIPYCFSVNVIVIVDCEPFSGLCLIGLPLPPLLNELAVGVRLALVYHFEVWGGIGWLSCFPPGREGLGMLDSFMIVSALLRPLAQGLWEAEIAVVLLPWLLRWE